MRLVILFFFILPFFGFWVEPVSGLAVTGERQSVIIELGDSGVIECSFVHSVEKSRVVEIYRVDRQGLVLCEARMKSFGWGLPGTEPGYSLRQVEGETWFVFDMSRSIAGLVIATDPVNDYTLRVGDRTLRLEDFGRKVEVGVRSFCRIGLGLPEWKMYLRVP